MLLEGKKVTSNKSKIVSMYSNNKSENDFKLFALICIIYLIGIILGSIYFRIVYNNENIKNDLLNSISIVNEDKISNEKNANELLPKILIKNLKTIIIFWVIGISVVGAPFLLFICIYRGFKTAFIISTIVANYGFITGNIFAFKKMILYYSLSFLAMILLSISSIKVCTNVLKKGKEIKFEIIRHSMVSIIAFILLFLASFLELFAII